LGDPSRPRGNRRHSRLALPLLGPGHNHIDVAAAAPEAFEPLAPLGNGGFDPVPLGHLGSIGFDLMAARFAPDDQPSELECDHGLTAPSARLRHLASSRSRANLRSRSRSAVGGYLVSVKAEPIEET